jgi:phytoene desaturase
VQSLVEIAVQAGVEFVYNAPVARIEVQGSQARGVVMADGELVAADAILANADLPYVYQEMLPQDELAERIAHKQFSYSTISFYWGVDKRYEMLAPHTLFLADEHSASYRTMGEDFTLPQHPNVYIHAPTRLDPSMAPPDQDTLIAIVPAGHLSANGEQDWGDIRDSARTEALRRLRTVGVTDLEAHLKFEECNTPLTWRDQYNLTKGAAHGLSHTLMQMAYFRPDNQHPRYRNLYFVGASTRPGTGIPTVLVSARLAVRRMLEHVKV